MRQCEFKDQKAKRPRPWEGASETVLGQGLWAPYLHMGGERPPRKWAWRMSGHWPGLTWSSGNGKTGCGVAECKEAVALAQAGRQPHPGNRVQRKTGQSSWNQVYAGRSKFPSHTFPHRILRAAGTQSGLNPWPPKGTESLDTAWGLPVSPVCQARLCSGRQIRHHPAVGDLRVWGTGLSHGTTKSARCSL